MQGKRDGMELTMEVITAAGSVCMLLSPAHAERSCFGVCTPVSLVVAKASQRASGGYGMVWYGMVWYSSCLSCVSFVCEGVYSTVRTVQYSRYRSVV